MAKEGSFWEVFRWLPHTALWNSLNVHIIDLAEVLTVARVYDRAPIDEARAADPRRFLVAGILYTRW